MTAEMIPASPLLLGNNVMPEEAVCPGCPHAANGHFPGLRRVTEADVDKGQPGDLVPACAKSAMVNVAHWQGHRGVFYPEALNPLRLFKCRMWLWVVVPGLRDDHPQEVQP